MIRSLERELDPMVWLDRLWSVSKPVLFKEDTIAYKWICKHGDWQIEQYSREDIYKSH